MRGARFKKNVSDNRFIFFAICKNSFTFDLNVYESICYSIPDNQGAHLEGLKVPIFAAV